jgi:hypothetical protein
MKTTLNQLLEWIRENPKYHEDKCWYVKTEDLNKKIQELIPVEKEIIENAYDKGNYEEYKHRYSLGDSVYKNSEDYYNKTFKDEEK